MRYLLCLVLAAALLAAPTAYAQKPLKQSAAPCGYNCQLLARVIMVAQAYKAAHGHWPPAPSPTVWHNFLLHANMK